MLAKAELKPEDLDAIFLAGGFGNYINVESAMTIGLLSPRFEGKVISLGNTSGAGALLALKSLDMEHVMTDIITRAEHLELSDAPEFAMEFAMNMLFEDDLIQ